MIHAATADLPADAELHVDLGAIVANWRAVAALAPAARCAAVVKADAYGLGVSAVAPALHAAGCEQFFVATLEEGIELRAILPDAEVLILNGLRADAAAAYAAHGLLPILNTAAQWRHWARHCVDAGAARPAAIQVDTGMTRLGMPEADYRACLAEPALADAFPRRLVMSHLACSDDPSSPRNGRQRADFEVMRRLAPDVPHSLAASSGVLLGPDYHYDLVRPGIALYGGNPVAGRANPFTPVVRLRARILQVHEAAAGARKVGYGASHEAAPDRRIATVAAGYADGYFRHLSDRSLVHAAGLALPVVGRVSMDMLAVDVTALPAEQAREGDWLELLGAERDIDSLAADAGTIAHEVLTALGRRYRRLYAPA